MGGQSCTVGISVERKQLDATEWFIALIICWTRFGHLYAHPQQFVGQDPGLLTADYQQPKHCTPYAVITQVQSRTPDDGHISARNMSSRL